MRDYMRAWTLNVFRQDKKELKKKQFTFVSWKGSCTEAGERNSHLSNTRRIESCQYMINTNTDGERKK